MQAPICSSSITTRVGAINGPDSPLRSTVSLLARTTTAFGGRLSTAMLPTVTSSVKQVSSHSNLLLVLLKLGCPANAIAWCANRHYVHWILNEI